MTRKKSKIRSYGKPKAGIECPVCNDIIFSMSRHDFRRCMCGKVFIDGGDYYMRYGAEPPVELEDVKVAYRPRREVERLMSRKVRDLLPLAPPPLSYFTEHRRYQVAWNWTKWWRRPRKTGPLPSSGKFMGAIYRWTIICGPLEIRRWEDEKAP